MKRLVLILSLVLLLALAACDTMGPPQEAISTGVAPVATIGEEGATALPQEVATAAPSTGEEAEGETTAGSDLLGVTWEWVSLVDPAGQTTATDPTRYTITFNGDGTANLKADCNNATATYVTDGVNLNIEPGATSLALCPSDTQDQLFLNSLSAADSYVVQDGELFITMVGESGTIIFRPAGSGGAAEGESTEGEAPEAAPALTGTTWEWTQTVTMVGTTNAADPTRYTVTFNEDGTANIQADCNTVLGNYTSDATGAFTLTLGPSTLMACPEDSQVNEFLAGLAVLGAYQFDGDNLILRNIAADGGAMTFRPAGAAQAPSGTSPIVPTELVGVTWEWFNTTTGAAEDIIVADPTRYQITFNDDGTAGMVADCNVGNATYTAGDDGTLTITLGVSTLAFCDNSQDTQFRAGLEAAASYAIVDGVLNITQTDGGTMRFRAAQVGGPPPLTTTDTLTGVTWQWAGTTTPVETIAVADPTRYAVVFNEDGTANITADCNVGAATYTTGEGGTITVTPGAMTLAMCPEDSQGTQFMAGLSSAAVYFFQDGDLYIDMFASGGTMRFTPATTTEGEIGGGEPGKGETGALPTAGDLTGRTWQLTLISKADGNITINDPTRYTLTLNADGTANVQADCNVNIMTYTLGEGNTLTITPGISTMAFCGPGSLDQVYLGGLSNAMGYRLEEGNLIIDMLYESGSLIFMPAG